MTKPDEPAAKIKAREGYLMTFQEPISKRELFAAMAMIGIMADTGDGTVSDEKEFAIIAVTLADALIAQLAKGDGG